MIERNYHSVVLDREKCKGCTNCIKNCPTEAIRVRDGKAKILEDRCIDCGECIRICPQHAKLAKTDELSILNNFRYRVVIPAPSLYGQFKEYMNPEKILMGLKKMGFDEVYEVALAAENVSIAVQRYLSKKNNPKPGISSACPAVVRLIQVRFPDLIKNIVPIKAPIEIAAKKAREKIKKEKGFKDDEIGVFFITPCPAKVTSIKSPVGAKTSFINGAFSVSQIYGDLLKNIKSVKESDLDGTLQKASGLGVGWGRSGGENKALAMGNTLSVDGIHNVIEVLEEVEMGRLKDIDFIEAQACIGGCVGGALMVEKQVIARTRLRKLSETLAQNFAVDEYVVLKEYDNNYYFMTEKIEPKHVMKLDEDIAKAIEKMELLEKTLERLPGLDCGSCGSPNCRALAEDIVRGIASENDCVFVLREKVKELAEEMLELSKRLPPAMGDGDFNRKGEKNET
ncbi:MAG: hypothetical protein PWP21_523 [Thermosediminibacterales bacterium]|nr:hypothetical protein [Thermosediminibacterales bacterium]